MATAAGSRSTGRGWSVGENLMSGSIEVHGNGGSSAARRSAAAACSRRDDGARTGISMKGGTLVVGGSVGYVRVHDAARHVIVCGDGRRHRRLDVRGHRVRGRCHPLLRADCIEADLADETGHARRRAQPHGIAASVWTGRSSWRAKALELLEARVRRLEGAMSDGIPRGRDGHVLPLWVWSPETIEDISRRPTSALHDRGLGMTKRPCTSRGPTFVPCRFRASPSRATARRARQRSRSEDATAPSRSARHPSPSQA